MPDFEDWKAAPLTSADPAQGVPEPIVADMLDRWAMAAGRRVLEVGCGRGDRVAWLLSHGFDAYGVDIADDYMEQGRPYIEQRGWGNDRLRSIVGEGLPFNSTEPKFDIVLSNQVIEHVEDLPAFVRGIQNVSRAGTVGLHAFPARWRPIQVHLGAPFVHWFPKGPSRRAAISVALKAGLHTTWPDVPPEQALDTFVAYSEQQTFYRPLRTVVKTFETHGMRVDTTSIARAKVEKRLPVRIVKPAAWLYERCWASYLTTTQA